MQRLYSGYGGVSAPCLAVADLQRDGEKIFAGETKPGVNRAQDSTVVIRAGGVTRSSCFLCFLAGFFCDVKCFTHVLGRDQEGAPRSIRDKISPETCGVCVCVCVREISDARSKRKDTKLSPEVFTRLNSNTCPPCLRSVEGRSDVLSR